MEDGQLAVDILLALAMTDTVRAEAHGVPSSQILNPIACGYGKEP